MVPLSIQENGPACTIQLERDISAQVFTSVERVFIRGSDVMFAKELKLYLLCIAAVK